MFKRQSHRTNLLCTMAGWGVALVLFMYSGNSCQWLHWQADHKSKQEKCRLESESPRVDTLPVDREPNGSQLDNLHQMVTVLAKRLELVKGEKSQHYSKPCTIGYGRACKSNCSHPLSRCPYERLHDLFMSPKLTLSDVHRQMVLSIAESVPEADIIFLTAASSNHYDEMQAMYHKLHTVIFPHISNYQAVLVDLGLSEKQIEMSKRKCQCKVIPFPWNKLPAHIHNIRCYTWKPLLVLALMEKARKHLVYMDASVRWRNIDQFREVLSRTQTRGVQFLRIHSSPRIPVHTIKQTFDYFGWEPCAFDEFPELQASFGFFKKEALVIQAILKPWAKCALETSCMCPEDPHTVQSCGGPNKHHKCHRFDQSVLGMLAARTFGNDMNKFIFTVPNKYMAITVNRTDKKPGYFSGS